MSVKLSDLGIVEHDDLDVYNMALLYLVGQILNSRAGVTSSTVINEAGIVRDAQAVVFALVQAGWPKWRP